MKSRKYILINAVLFLLVFLSCSKNELIKDYDFGSNLNKVGKISDKNLEYSFVVNEDFDSLADFCNFVYFEGDAFCFSIVTSRELSQSDVSAYYRIKGRNKKYRVERLEVNKNSVYGFSLIGTIFEYYFEDDLEDIFEDVKIPQNMDIQLVVKMKSSELTEEKVIDQNIFISLKK